MGKKSQFSSGSSDLGKVFTAEERVWYSKGFAQTRQEKGTSGNFPRDEKGAGVWKRKKGFIRGRTVGTSKRKGDPWGGKKIVR